MNGILCACQVENIATRKDRTVKITLGTQELSQGKAGELFNLVNKVVAVYISEKETIPQKDLDQVDAIDQEFGGKTQSQRLRNVLFVLWQQVPEGYTDFNNYYKFKTEAMIDHFKSKIPA